CGCLCARRVLRSGECADDNWVDRKQTKVPPEAEEHREEDEQGQQSFTLHGRTLVPMRRVTGRPTGSRTRDARTRRDFPSARRIPSSAALPPPRPARAPCSAAASAGRKSSHTSRTAP